MTEAVMSGKPGFHRLCAALMLVVSATIFAGCQSFAAKSTTVQEVMLSGSNEVPPVNTAAGATGTVDVTPDRRVTVTIVVTGMTPTAAHLHEAAAGNNGPVILPLNKVGDNRFVAPENAR